MIEKEKFQKFLSEVTETLEGDWLIIGGSLIAILIPDTRVTQDIDICSIDEMNNDKRLALMNIAHKLNMPVESINPAADFFLRQVSDWKKSIILLKQGKKGRLFRPSFELYFSLKLKRLSESDFQDIHHYFDWCRVNDKNIDLNLIEKILLDEIKLVGSNEKRQRLDSLHKYLLPNSDPSLV